MKQILPSKYLLVRNDNIPVHNNIICLGYRQDELVLEAEYDDLQGEQTWPSEQEMIQHDAEGNRIDADAENDDISLGDDEEEEEGMEFFNREQLPGSSKPKSSLVQLMEEANERGNRDNGEEDEEDQGDIVDTPIDMPARTRFARYRFLQSFRSSVWNPKQNLPPQYSKIFEFEDMKGMQRR